MWVKDRPLSPVSCQDDHDPFGSEQSWLHVLVFRSIDKMLADAGGECNARNHFRNTSVAGSCGKLFGIGTEF